MLHGHRDRVNCVRWISWRSGHAQSRYGKATPLELVSGAVDNDVIVWRQLADGSEVTYYCLTLHRYNDVNITS